jgi:hypothetical protein
VLAWVTRVWNARGSRDGAGTLGDFSSPEWNSLLASIAEEYLPYLDRNAQAYARGEKRLDLKLGDVTYPGMRVVRYRVACREQLLKEYAALDEGAKRRVQARLESSGIGRWLESSAPIPSGLDAEFELPLPRRYPPARGLYGLRMLGGTPWDLPSPPQDPPDR